MPIGMIIEEHRLNRDRPQWRGGSSSDLVTKWARQQLDWKHRSAHAHDETLGSATGRVGKSQSSLAEASVVDLWEGKAVPTGRSE